MTGFTVLCVFVAVVDPEVAQGFCLNHPLRPLIRIYQKNELKYQLIEPPFPEILDQPLYRNMFDLIWKI